MAITKIGSKGTKFTDETDGLKLPKGTTAQRSTEVAGTQRFNTTTGLMEYYTGNEWKSIDAPPTVSSINGGSTATLTTTQIAAGTAVTIGGSGFSTTGTTLVKTVDSSDVKVSMTSVTVNSSSQITATPATSLSADDDPFTIEVTNPSGLTGNLNNGLILDAVPTFVTAAGSLGTLNDSNSYDASNLTTVQATDPESTAVTFEIISGSLPTGASFNTTTGAFSGTVSDTSTQTYNITIRAKDATSTTSERAFSIAVTAPQFLAATGGTESNDGDYKVHTFNSSSNFVVSRTGADSTYGNKVQYLVVAGGGGGGGGLANDGNHCAGGGGGAGGLLRDTGYNHVVSAQTYAVVVGGGGSGGSNTSRGSSGSTSSFSNFSAAGGGGGGSAQIQTGLNGGSGGGAGGDFDGGNSGGAGNTPSTSPSQGNSGGDSTNSGPSYGAGGGGGHGNAGGNGSANQGGSGGSGTTLSYTGSSVGYSGGGGGGVYANSGHGTGSEGGGSAGANGNAATVNRGGGGGGMSARGGTAGSGGSGASGRVVIRYKVQ